MIGGKLDIKKKHHIIKGNYMVIKPYTISFLDNMMQTFYVMKQNNREYTFSLCCSISGIEETIVSLFSTVS